jgi:hypothetical protein
MYLRSVRMERYRPFAKRQEVELRPLTIVIGKNNSGKSALVRLPLLLQKSLSGAAHAPLDLDIEGVDLGRSFVDLVYGRVSSLTRPLRVGATFGVEGTADELSIDADILHSDERRLQVVHTFQARHAGARYMCRYAGPETPPAFGPSVYDVERRASSGSTELSSLALRFDGLWPVVVAADGTERPLVGDERLTAQLRLAMRDVRYLGPFRDVPKREYAVPSGSPRTVGLHGRNAPAVLGADSLRFDRQLIGHVSAFYREHLGRWNLDAVVDGDSFELVDGEVDFWPEGVFAEDFEEVREMRRAQDRRGLRR